MKKGNATSMPSQPHETIPVELSAGAHQNRRFTGLEPQLWVGTGKIKTIVRAARIVEVSRTNDEVSQQTANRYLTINRNQAVLGSRIKGGQCSNIGSSDRIDESDSCPPGKGQHGSRLLKKL
jgi:Tfp pilus assembly protein PilV